LKVEAGNKYKPNEYTVKITATKEGESTPIEELNYTFKTLPIGIKGAVK
jgi:hypothetical protein